jgi:hypothetical protein
VRRCFCLSRLSDQPLSLKTWLSTARLITQAQSFIIEALIKRFEILWRAMSSLHGVAPFCRTRERNTFSADKCRKQAMWAGWSAQNAASAIHYSTFAAKKPNQGSSIR